MDMPERLRPWLERTGLEERGHLPMRTACLALARSVSTFADARRLTDVIIDRLGLLALVEEENGPQRWVTLRDRNDPAWLLSPAIVDEQGWGPVGDVPEPPKDRIVPKGADMHAGKLVLNAGRATFAIGYGRDGVRNEIQQGGGDSFAMQWQGEERPFVFDPRARPPTPPVHPMLLRPDLRADGHELAEIAGWIAALADTSSSDVLMFAPEPLPLGSQAIRLRTRTSLAVALWQGLVPTEARWLALDGWCGRALSAGATREEAVRGLAAEIWRVKPALIGEPGGEPLPFELHAVPRPEDDVVHLPVPPRSPEDGGVTTVFSKTMSIAMGPFVSRHAWPKPEPATSPAVLVRLPPAPEVPASFARAGFAPVAVVGENLRVAWVLRREDVDGWTLIGTGVLDLVDPEALDDELDEAEMSCADDWRELFPNGWDGQERPICGRWSLWDNERQRRGPLCAGGSSSGGFHPSQLDHLAEWQVVRVRV